MYSYTWDAETGGLLLNSSPLGFSKEPRPVYYKELDVLGFDKYWEYAKNDTYPYMWAESNNYFYRGRLVAKTKGGSLYTAPEIRIIEDPEPIGTPLKFVDVPAMVEKNKDILEKLVQETIKKVYNTYIEYQDKVDIFHVSYSGGKDSEVTFDIVQRALPHNAFVVLFGDTGMEFPDSYDSIENVKKICNETGINFYIAKSDFKPIDSWKKFGAPSSALRWCCGVHKTAPQLLKLRDITGKYDLKEMAFVGVRSSESVKRSEYDYISFGTKHSGQFSFNPILEWNSAEVYLYIYSQGLFLHEAYKKGSSRVGCLFCPMATEKSDFINRTLYPKNVDPFIDIVKTLYVNSKKDSSLLDSYLENKAWKARKNGRDLSIGIGDFDEQTINDKRVIKLKRNETWKEWIKTVGFLDKENNTYRLQIGTSLIFYFTIKISDDDYQEFYFDNECVKNNVVEFKKVKNVLKKSHVCIACRYCEANCPYGNISFTNGSVHISDKCIKCGLCSKIDDGCLLYSSLKLPKGTGIMKKGSIDEYGTHPIKLEWLKEYVKYKDEFDNKNTLGSAMLPMFRKFLRNSGIVGEKNQKNYFTSLLFRDGLEPDYIWAIMYSNLAYSQQFYWLIKNLDFGTTYSQNEIKDMISQELFSKTGPGNVANSYKKISELPFSAIGFGRVCEKNKDGYIFIRTPWEKPEPRVILYSLYKFAEKCGDYYQFTLTRLLNHDIDSNGVSPTEIFGIDREKMEKILTGLSINYPEFISAQFNLDLDTITLNSDKKSEDVLKLF